MPAHAPVGWPDVLQLLAIQVVLFMESWTQNILQWQVEKDGKAVVVGVLLTPKRVVTGIKRERRELETESGL